MIEIDKTHHRLRLQTHQTMLIVQKKNTPKHNPKSYLPVMFSKENWSDGCIGPQIFPNFFWSRYTTTVALLTWRAL